MEKPFRICLFGAPGDTPNLGVSALMHSAVAAIASRAPEAEVTVFDNGWGTRPTRAVMNGVEFRYDLRGARLSRRFHRPESFWNMRLAGRFGGLWNRGYKTVRSASAVWDVTGGDSFTDLYGPWRFRLAIAPKELALQAGVPLLLLPQTYGPFSNQRTEGRARRIIEQSACAWARDERSFEYLAKLLGDGLDPERHRSGVDMAFGLESYEPAGELLAGTGDWLSADRARPTVGINVSGLIYNDPRAAEKYRLRADYRGVMRRLVSSLLDETDANVVLVPHVLDAPGRIESDVGACQDVVEGLDAAGRERVRALPPAFDQCEVKWIISRLDWFCGTRMHSTIAALSSGVPVAGIAYSRKIQGVFDRCGQGEHVADLRSMEDGELFERLWDSWNRRAQSRATLAETLPPVLRRAAEQMDVILESSRPS